MKNGDSLHSYVSLPEGVPTAQARLLGGCQRQWAKLMINQWLLWVTL